MCKLIKRKEMKFKSIYLIAIALVMITIASCKKDLLKNNTNPDQITASQYDPNLLLTTVQLNYTGSTNFGGSVWATKWGGASMFVQHSASTNPGFYYGDKYLNNIGGMGEMFQDSYTSDVQPVVELYALTINNKKYINLHQMARIMKAMVFEQITDLYGDIPYKQAGLGYYDRIYTPVYDRQQDIYADLLKEVSEATDSLGKGTDAPTGDILYSQSGAQIDKWKMFGNSLLLRIAMRLTKIDPATAQKYVTQVIGKTMKSNDDNAIVQHVSGLDINANRDAVQIFGNDSVDLRLSNTFISNLKTNKDPRLPVVSWIYITQVDADGNTIAVNANNNPADQLGMPNGYIVGGKNTAVDLSKTPNYPKIGIFGYSRLNDNILNTSAPDLILTYSETELLLADAAKRWNIGGSAKSHYDAGVKAAITQLSAYGDAATISDDDAQTYLDNHEYNDATALEQINTQYWICTLMDEYESFANWRRSDFPVLVPVNYPGNITSGQYVPRRFTYPPSQKITNGENYIKAIAAQGPDKVGTRVWWDKDNGQP